MADLIALLVGLPLLFGALLFAAFVGGLLLALALLGAWLLDLIWPR